MSDVAAHNSGQWLAVVDQTGVRFARGRGRYHRRQRGWYVIRTCPCHAGAPVTRRYATEAEAWSAFGALVAVSMTLGT